MYKHLEEFIKEYKFNIDNNKFKKNELYLMNNIIKTNNIIETDNSNLLWFIGVYYKCIIKDNDKAKEYLLKTIELNNDNAMVSYASLLLKENKIEEAKLYYLKAIEQNNSNALHGYGNILVNEKRLTEAKYYYLRALKLNNTYTLNNYANLLSKENKIEEAIEYYLKAIKLNDKTALKNYLLFDSDIVSKLKKYIQLSSITSDITKDTLIELEKDRDVLILKNKLKRHSEIKDCEICYENKLNIELNCFNHMVCTDCYIEVYNDKCPFCRL